MDLELVQVRLRCPVVSGLHPAAERIGLHTLGWALEHGLVRPGGDRYLRFREHLAAALAARCYPRVSVPQLELASDWIAFLYFYDERVATAAVADPETLCRLTAFEDRIVALLRPSGPPPADEPLLRALADIRRRLAREACGRPRHRWDASLRWFRRFADHTERYLHGVRWDRLLRLEREAPDVTLYRHLRPLTSAVFSCFDLAALFTLELETAALESSTLQLLEEMASNYVSWVDDLMSYDKDVAEGRRANLVLILQQRLGLTFAKARDETIGLCNRELEAFFDIAAELGPLGEATPGVEAYVGALVSWLRGNLDAYGISRRYADPKLEWFTASAGSPDRG